MNHDQPSEHAAQPVKKIPGFIKGLITGIVVLIVLLGVFQLGIFVGSHKAGFAFKRYGFYNNMPGGPPSHGQMGLPLPGTFDPNGAVGSVISNDGKRMVLKGLDGSEKIIVFSTSTEIQDGPNVIKPSDISENKRVVIFGNPDDKGQIEAKFIRLLDRR